MASDSIDMSSLRPWIEQDGHWLSDPRLPISDVAKMVAYMRRTPQMSWALKTMIINDKEMPQSYAHWWCMSRAVYPKKLFHYPTFKKWADVGRQWWENAFSDQGGVIAMFQSWLDLIRLDMRIFDDDGFRKGTPRLTKSGTIIIPTANTDYEGGPTREDTVRFIINEGKTIFSERGWSKGEEYWYKYTKTF